MGTTIGNKDIVTTQSGHTTMTPPAVSMIPPVPPGPGPVPAPFPYTARSATATKTESALEAGGAPVVVKGSVLDVDPPANAPARPPGIMDIVTHVVQGKAKVTEGSSNTKANNKEVSATGDGTSVNVMTGNEEVAQESHMPLLLAGGADMAGDKDGEGAEGGKKGKRATPAKPADKCTDGHPVDVATGDVVDEAVDLALPGAIPFAWRRTYTSRAARERTTLGKGGWAHSYEQWVDEIDGVIYQRNAEGREVEFERVAPGGSAFNRRERLTLTAGKSRSYRVYDHRARLTSVFEPLSPEGPAMLRAIQDAYGHAIALEYERGRLSRIVDTARREIRVQSDAEGRVARLEVWAAPPAPPPDPARPSAPAPRPRLQLWFDYAYHKAGELASATNALGHTDRYAYDALHRMMKTTLKNGVSFYYEYDDDIGWCVKTWGDGGLHTVVLKPDFKKKTTHTSGKTEPRLYTWNDDGLVVREETLDGSFVREREYDADHYLLSEANAAGEKTAYEYDARGNRTKIVDPAGNETSLEYAEDLLRRRVAPSELVNSFAYDERGALIGVTYASGLAYSLRYDADGRLSGVYGADGQLTAFGYDAHHNPIHEVDARGGHTRYTCDALGRALDRVDPLGRRTRIEYDALGRRSVIHLPDGSATRAEYDPLGRLQRFTDARGDVATLEHAGTGVLTRITLPDGRTWAFAYDDEARPRRITNPRGERYEFEYDAAGRVERERTFDGRILHYRYSLAERLARIDYPDRTFREFSHDPLGNVVEERSSHGAITFERDELGRIRKAVLDEHGGKIVNAFERDRLGRLVAEKQGDRTIRYDRDDHGRLGARVLPDGATTRYYYDRLGALVALDHDGHKTAFERDVLGRETRRHVYQGKVDIQSAYDAMSRLVEQRVSAPSLAGGGAHAVLSQRRYAYDAGGRLAQIDDARWGATHYRHDALGDLIEARRGRFTEVFEYDALGALVNALDDLTRTGAPPWTAQPGNVLTRTGDARFAYDARGRRVRKITQRGERDEVTAYDWDCRDRLREVRLPNGERVLFTYDAFGRRVRKEIVPAERGDYAMMTALALERGREALPRTRVVEFLWEGSTLAAELDARQGDRVFVHDPGTGVPLLQQEQGAVFTYVNDHLGTPRELVDPDGRVAWAVARSAWGRPVESWRDPKSAWERPVETPLRMLGQYADEETELCCTLFRYFDPAVARWLSPDPLGATGGTDLFGFNASPLAGVDPLGLACPTQEQIDHAVANVNGLTEEQARLIMSLAFQKGRESSVVFGGSRVRGNNREDSDLDVGFGSLSKAQAGKVIDAATAAGPLSLEETRIVPGNKPPRIDPAISTPEEFFARTGTRTDPGREGEPFNPSGSITYNPDGTIVDNRIK